jgi:hypothetical protein
MNYASSYWTQVIISVLLCAFCAIMIVRDNNADTRAIYLPILSATCSRFYPVFRNSNEKKKIEDIPKNTSENGSQTGEFIQNPNILSRVNSISSENP